MYSSDKQKGKASPANGAGEIDKEQALVNEMRKRRKAKKKADSDDDTKGGMLDSEC